MGRIIYLNKVSQMMDTAIAIESDTDVVNDNYNEVIKATPLNRNTFYILNDLKRITPEEIVSMYNPEGIYPFDIFKMINNMGILVTSYDFSNLENTVFKKQVKDKGEILGAVVANSKKIAIFYDQNSSENRTKFTVAHELAHCCLDLNFDDSKGKLSHIEFRNNYLGNSIDKKEYRANIFAGEILIPQKPLDYVIGNLMEPNILNLSKFFGVSQNVMYARLRYLGYIE